MVASCTNDSDDAVEAPEDTAVTIDASAEDRGSSAGAVSPDTAEIGTGDSVGAGLNDLPEGLSECRSTQPLAGDWCVVSGEVPEGGSVRIEGPLTPLSLVPEGGAYAVAVPLGIVEQPTISVTTLDAAGEVTDVEELTISRADRSGEFTVSVEVRTQTDGEFGLGELVAGAEVTIAGQTLTTDEFGSIEFDALPAESDLVHVAAEGYIGRLDSINLLVTNDQSEYGSQFRSPEQARVLIELQRLADPVPVDRGDSSVQLNDEVRLVFGAAGAPTATEVSLTEAPSIGTALFGAPTAFDISPVELGPGGAVHVALPDDVLDDVDLPDQIEAQLWDPGTATKRSVMAEIDADARTLVLPVEEIRGDTIRWIYRDLLRIRTTEGGPAAPDMVQQFVPDGVRVCGAPDDAYTITHEFDYYAASSQDPGPAGAAEINLGLEGLGITVNIGEFIRSYEGVDVQPLHATVRVPEGKRLRQPAYINVALNEVVNRLEAPAIVMGLLGIGDEFTVLYTWRSVEPVDANFVTRGGGQLTADDFDDYEQTNPNDCSGIAGIWETTGRGLNLLTGDPRDFVRQITITILGNDSFRLTGTFPCGHRMIRTLEPVGGSPVGAGFYQESPETLDQSGACDYTDCLDPSPPRGTGFDRDWIVQDDTLYSWTPEGCDGAASYSEWRRVGAGS